MFKSVDETYLELKSQLENGELNVTEGTVEQVEAIDEVMIAESATGVLLLAGTLATLTGLTVWAIKDSKDKKAAMKWYAEKNKIPMFSELKSKTFSMDRAGDPKKELKSKIAQAFAGRQIIQKSYNGKQFLAYTKITTVQASPYATYSSGGGVGAAVDISTQTNISVALTDSIAKKHSEYYMCAVGIAEGVTNTKNTMFMNKIVKMYKEEKKAEKENK